MSDFITVALALATGPLARFALLLAVVCAVVTVVLVAARAVGRWSDARVEADVRAALATEATDWGEPSRAHVEAGWLDEVDEFWWIFPVPEFKDTPIFQQLRHEHDVRFAAAVLSDIEDLTGGDAA